MEIGSLSFPGANLTIAVVDLRFVAAARMRLPGYSGSAWRGAFGIALKPLACLADPRRCDPCRNPAICAYAPFFETNAAGAAAAFPEPTRPFRIAPPWNDGRLLEKGDAERVRLTLVGKAVATAALCIKAMSDAGRAGIGPDRGALHLEAVNPVPVDPLHPDGDKFVLRFETPLRIAVENALIGPSDLAPFHVLMTLLRRVSGLVRLHAGAELAVDFGALKAAARDARFERTDFTWAEWARHSARQGRLVRMGGILGQAAISIEAAAAFRPFLAAAPWLGVGKGTTMGLGAIAFGADGSEP